jgi:hypothetical protein
LHEHRIDCGEAHGSPARVYRFGGYTIMVYDYNLLTRVTVPAELWPGFRPG